MTESAWKPYEEVQVTPNLILRWIREGDEYVMRVSKEDLEAYKLQIETQPEQDKLLVDLIQEQRKEIDRLRKPWVGLTDEEIVDIFEQGDGEITFARAVELKLKEKNT